jgi:FixJ family two-component response regulator
VAYDEGAGVTAFEFRDDRPAAPASVLIIDDEVRPDDSLVALLSLDGFHVTCVSTGAEGIARAFATEWAAIVLDLHLPDILGITVLSQLRRRGFRFPVFVTTGWYLSSGHREAASALGAAGFLPKPLLADELARTLRREIFLRARATPEDRPIVAERILETKAAPTRPRLRATSEEDDVLRPLYDRAIAGDRLAADALCERLLPALERSICRNRDRKQAEWAHDAVQDALIEFRADPLCFDANRHVPLIAFLRMVARRNLLNRIDSERRRRAHEVPAGDGLIDANMGIPDYERRLDLERAVSVVWAGLSHVERRVFALILRGERDTAVLARAAQGLHVTAPDQARVAKRITNRIFQRLRRMRRSR